MKSLIDFSFLKFSDHFHIFFADGVIFEIIEFSCIIAEIQQIDFSLMLFIELFNIILDIEIVAEF